MNEHKKLKDDVDTGAESAAEQETLRGVHGGREHAHSKVLALAGKEIADAPSVSDSLHETHDTKANEKDGGTKKHETSENTARQRLRDVVDEIDSIVNQLSSLNLAHRSHDFFRSLLTPWEMVRSWSRVNSENKLIEDLATRIGEVEALGPAAGVDINKFVKSLHGIRSTSWAGRALGTLLIPLRDARKAYSAPVLEHVQRDLLNIRGAIRRKNSGTSTAESPLAA